MKILTIGDIHGRDYWIDQGDIRSIKEIPYVNHYDKYIFLGDYCDSFDKTNAQIMHNLKQIVTFKHNYANEVVLLLGNHDLQYVFSHNQYGCSGYRPSAYTELHMFFSQYKYLFQPIYQINNYLFSHAGITTVWYNQLLDYLKNHKIDPEPTIGETISKQFYFNNPLLFQAGRSRGGYNKSGGPFWADKSETMNWVLPNYHQIVGHTQTEDIITHEWKEGNASITYCDTVYDSYELEI